MLECTTNNYEITGDDLGQSVEVKNAGLCQVRCTRNKQCNYWTFKKSDKKCFLRQKIKKAIPSSGFQSGARTCLDKDKESKNINNKSKQISRN